MKIKEIKLNQVVIQNSKEYKFKGVNKIRIANHGWTQKIVFENTVDPKDRILLNLNEGNRDISHYKIETK